MSSDAAWQVLAGGRLALVGQIRRDRGVGDAEVGTGLESCPQGLGERFERRGHVWEGGALDSLRGLADGEAGPAADLGQAGDDVPGAAGGRDTGSMGGGHVGGGDLASE